MPQANPPVEELFSRSMANMDAIGEVFRIFLRMQCPAGIMTNLISTPAGRLLELSAAAQHQLGFASSYCSA